MDINKIPAGKNVPSDVNVIIEVPCGVHPVKYEMDKDSGALFVDRMIHTPMYYPCHYGFIPHTLSDDGDPTDVLVVSREPIVPGAVLAARPIGVLLMEDESGQDEKILAVPAARIHPYYNNIENYTDLPQVLLDQIKHFFEHYKDLEKNKWVKVTGWGDRAKAESLIEQGIKTHNKKYAA
jgi:inorganic pyrophosphatase